MKWRIVQVGERRFRIRRQKRFLFFSWWTTVDFKDNLDQAQTAMERLIMAEHTFPRIVEEVSDEVAYVRARLK
jgi:hypothetical protein